MTPAARRLERASQTAALAAVAVSFAAVAVTFTAVMVDSSNLATVGLMVLAVAVTLFAVTFWFDRLAETVATHVCAQGRHRLVPVSQPLQGRTRWKWRCADCARAWTTYPDAEDAA